MESKMKMKRFLASLILITLTLSFFIGCKKQTTGPSEVIYIKVSPSSLNFGTVPITFTKDMSLIVKNERNSTGRLNGSVNVSGAGFSVQGSSQFNLAPGESISVVIRFAPTSGSNYSGKVVITHNATNIQSPYEVQLSGSGDETILKIINLIQSGWQLFTARNYDGALVKFDSAVTLARTNTIYDSLQASAECGRGWTRAYRREFSLAKNDLLNSLAHQSISQNVKLNSKAGLSLVHHALNEFSAAIQRALEVLNENANYVFEYDNRVYHKRLRLVLAQSYYTLGDFQNAAKQLDIIDPAGAPHSTDPVVLLKQIQDMWSRL